MRTSDFLVRVAEGVAVQAFRLIDMHYASAAACSALPARLPKLGAANSAGAVAVTAVDGLFHSSSSSKGSWGKSSDPGHGPHTGQDWRQADLGEVFVIEVEIANFDIRRHVLDH